MTDLNQLQAEATGAEYILYDTSDAQPTYVGINRSATASQTTSQDWVIYKFTYSGTDVTQILKKRGAWGDRVALFA